MATPPDTSDPNVQATVLQALRSIVDPEWYLQRYPDVSAAGLDPVLHFSNYGAAERRDPNAWFDSVWYADHYPDVGASGINPLLHYLRSGAAEMRNPHPRFDAAWYVVQHPDAARNPLVYHLTTGAARGYATEKTVDIKDYLPSTIPVQKLPRRVRVDVIIPVYRGLEQTRACIESVLADTDRPPGRIIVVDDKSPEPSLPAWLDKIAKKTGIVVVHNRRNLGFVASVNRGMAEAGDHDVALLNSDTEVPNGWLTRLALHAYAQPRIASVSSLSNNATICSYPTNDGGPILFDLPLATVDDACRTVNAGRAVSVPTTVGFCMYIRREALDDLGNFDEEGFGRGYGEENDFCMRALKRGWRHLLACDVFVYHEGSVSFKTDTEILKQSAGKLLRTRYPQYETLVSMHIGVDAVGPYRFAITLELFRKSGKPTILLVCHGLGGGVNRHIDGMVDRLSDQANFLLLLATDRGATLTVPAVENHPEMSLPAERLDDLVTLLRSVPVTRVHIHHLDGMDMDIRALIQKLDVPFDVTVHDYYALCPQVNMLPWTSGPYCGEPGPATCNACISVLPSHGAKEILSWRREKSWQYLEADRVICPSEDVRARLTRFGLGARAIVAPHQPVTKGNWPVTVPALRGRTLRVAMLGVYARLKGAHVVDALTQMVDPADIEVHLIGPVEDDVPKTAAERIVATGKYAEADLPDLLSKIRPHVIWFPGMAPETYSYTLTTAIESGLPIVAPRIGAFTERLQGRPQTWMVEPTVATAPWIEALEQVRTSLRGKTPRPAPAGRSVVADFYGESYLRPALDQIAPRPATPRRDTASLASPAIGCAKDRKPRVVVIPERFDRTVLSPCAYIRLLQPLDHPDIGGEMEVVLADVDTALRYKADVFVTHRGAISDIKDADALAAHARETGAKLLYDLDDDLLNIPSTHPDAAELRPLAKVVGRMIRNADHVWVSTEVLRTRLQALRKDVRIVANGLDERLWQHQPIVLRDRLEPVRILCMGTATHDSDFAIIQPVLQRLVAEFGYRVSIDMIGVTSRPDLPSWINRMGTTPNASHSYPGFVNWLTRQRGWDIGLAPLADTDFNLSKSSIKTWDYAARGMAVVASDMPVYRGSVADGPGGALAANTEAAWFTTLSWLVRDDEARRRLGRGAQEAFAAAGSLASQAEDRRQAWADVLQPAKGPAPRTPASQTPRAPARPTPRAPARPASRPPGRPASRTGKSGARPAMAKE